MKCVAACFVATFVACLLFLFGMDAVHQRVRAARESREHPKVDKVVYDRVADEARDLRGAWWILRQEGVDRDRLTVRTLASEMEQRARADAAEARVASLEQQLATFKVLADVRRRDEAKIPLLGDDPADLLPPQNVPLP